MSNVQWIFPVAHIATLLLVARNKVFWTWARTSDTSEIDINSSNETGDELD